MRARPSRFRFLIPKSDANSKFQIPNSKFGGGAVCILLAVSLSRLPFAAAEPWPVKFLDVADRAGLREPTVYGGVDRKRFIIETNGAGVAFLDYDNDGWVDALVLNGTRLKDGSRQEKAWPASEAPTNRLYRNNHDGTFADVTDRAGLRRTGFASSVC